MDFTPQLFFVYKRHIVRQLSCPSADLRVGAKLT